MSNCAATTPAGEVLTAIDRLLDQVDPRRSDLPPQTRLEWLRLARRVQGRIEALTGVLTAEADRAQASVRTAGTPLASWLGTGENLSRREASGAVLRARALGERPLVAQAATAGEINPGQAQAIGAVLGELTPQLTADQRGQAERVMVGLASHMDSAELARAGAQVLAAVVGPESSQLVAEQQQRAVELAHRRRSLRFFRDGASVRFDGSLPRLEGEAFISLIEAHGEARRRTAVEARDPLHFDTPEQRRADALIELISAAQHTKPDPGVGVARVLVKLDLDRLREGAAAAGVIGDGEELSAGELRRVCCDAELVPVVLGGTSEVLDVGRASRLVTAPLRSALTMRDGGCVFPGCDVTPNRCEAHHIQPWWNGGATALGNLALLCHHHHGMVEPATVGHRDQWELRIGADGLPELLPPRRLDRWRRPIRHRRHGGDGTVARGDPPGSGGGVPRPRSRAAESPSLLGSGAAG